MESRLAELEGRLVRAEDRERALRRQVRALFSLVLTIVLGALLLVGAKPARTQSDGYSVSAPFRVVDGSGQPLLQVESNEGGALLSLFNRSGDAAVQVGTSVDGGALQINGTADGTMASLGVDQMGGQLTLTGDQDFTAP
jgi:hypothetical protein